MNMPLAFCLSVTAHLDTLKGLRLDAWDSEFWNIAEWRR